MGTIARASFRVVLITVCTVVAFAMAPCAFGQSALPDELSEWSVDGGGGTFSDGSYEITGTFGQPDCEVLTGGVHELEGGLWHSFSPAVPVELMSFEVVAVAPAVSEPEVPTRAE